MDLRECCALLDKENHYTKMVELSLRSLSERQKILFERKGEDLVEVVQRLKDGGFYPVIDKGLKLILGAEFACHDLICQELFRYYYYEGDPKGERLYVKPNESADRYILNGMGYFISSTRPNIIILSRKYRPDNFDYALFALYTLRFNDG